MGVCTLAEKSEHWAWLGPGPGALRVGREDRSQNTQSVIGPGGLCMSFSPIEAHSVVVRLVGA